MIDHNSGLGRIQRLLVLFVQENCVVERCNVGEWVQKAVSPGLLKGMMGFGGFIPTTTKVAYYIALLKLIDM